MAIHLDNKPILCSKPRYFLLLNEMIKPIIPFEAKNKDINNPSDKTPILFS